MNEQNITSKIVADVRLLRATGGAPGVAETEISDLADALAMMLPPTTYSFGALENALRILLQKRRGAEIAAQICV